MLLITKAQRRRLLRNGARRDADHPPVVKIFSPIGAATWLISEMDPQEPDILFGLCDLGLGFPELGYVSLHELESVRVEFGIKGPDNTRRGGSLPLERDLHFKGRYPMSVYTEVARLAGYINTDPAGLTEAAARS